MNPPFDQLNKEETLQLGNYVTQSLERVHKSQVSARTRRKEVASARNQIEANIPEHEIEQELNQERKEP